MSVSGVSGVDKVAIFTIFGCTRNPPPPRRSILTVPNELTITASVYSTATDFTIRLDSDARTGVPNQPLSELVLGIVKTYASFTASLDIFSA
jgi:hypothetical protein